MQINVSNSDALIIAVTALTATAAILYPDAAAGFVAAIGEWLQGVAA